MDSYMVAASGSTVAQYEGTAWVPRGTRLRGLEDRLADAYSALADLRLEVGYYRADRVAVPSYLADDVRAAARRVAVLERMCQS